MSVLLDMHIARLLRFHIKYAPVLALAGRGSVGELIRRKMEKDRAIINECETSPAENGSDHDRLGVVAGVVAG